MNKSWKTTLAGAVGAIGVYLSTLEGNWRSAGQVLTALGIFLNGLVGRDNDKSSSQLGLK